MVFTNIKESLLVLAIFTGILLPVRILFVHFIGNNWLGSFGLLTLVSLSILILAKKNKLGRFGEIFKRQMIKWQHGKRKKFFYIESSFWLSFFIFLVASMNLGQTTYSEQTKTIETNTPQVLDLKTNLEQAKEMPIENYIVAILLIPYLIVNDYPLVASILAIENDSSHGYFLSILTVLLVEQIEIIGIFIMYRFTLVHNMGRIEHSTK